MFHEVRGLNCSRVSFGRKQRGPRLWIQKQPSSASFAWGGDSRDPLNRTRRTGARTGTRTRTGAKSSKANNNKCSETTRRDVDVELGRPSHKSAGPLWRASTSGRRAAQSGATCLSNSINTRRKLTNSPSSRPTNERTLATARKQPTAPSYWPMPKLSTTPLSIAAKASARSPATIAPRSCRSRAGAVLCTAS